MKFTEIRVNPEFESKLPGLTDEEFLGLEKDIVKYKGRTDRDPLDDPIHVWAEGNYIIDGHNRYKILVANKMETKNIRVHDEFENKSDVIKWMIDHQRHRRNLTVQQKVTMVAEWEKEIAKEAKERQLAAQNNDRGRAVSSNLNEQVNAEPIRTAAEAAKMAGMSENSYRDAKLILEKGSGEKIERMNKGGRGNGVSSIANEVREGIPDGKRKCRTCGQIKDLSEFKKSGKEGISTICKSCYNESKRVKKIKPLSATQPEEGSAQEEVVPEEVDDDIKAFIKKSYAPASYYDTTTRPERTLKDAIDMMENVCKESIGKIEIVLKRYEDILRSNADRDRMANVLKEFRAKTGNFENNLRYTTHI